MLTLSGNTQVWGWVCGVSWASADLLVQFPETHSQDGFMLDTAPYLLSAGTCPSGPHCGDQQRQGAQTGFPVMCKQMFQPLL